MIVYELLHLRIPNYGRLFRAKLRAFLARDGGPNTAPEKA